MIKICYQIIAYISGLSEKEEPLSEGSDCFDEGLGYINIWLMKNISSLRDSSYILYKYHKETIKLKF